MPFQAERRESLLRAVFSVPVALGALSLGLFYSTVSTVEKGSISSSAMENAASESTELLRKAEGFKPAKLAQKGKYIDAVVAAQNLLEEKPHEPAAYLCAGNVMLKAGLKEDALRHLKTACAMAPKNRFVKLAYARALATTGHLTDAVTQYQAIAQQLPRWYDARMELAQLLMVNNQPGEAVKELQEITRLFPEKSLAHKLLGVALARSGKAEEGMDEYMAGIVAEGRTGQPEALQEILSSWGSMDKAKYYLEQRVEEHPNDPLLKLRLAQVYMYVNQLDEAKKTLLDARKHAPANAEIRRSLCVLYLKMGERKPALAEFVQSVGLEKEAEKKRLNKS
ncbi:MAG: tetratricopeptide repeat protein [Candidatus Obscuribacterales bacterium]|nr:tetratricopeptide repeat protein [Candidatus Obscuribacterales bacterium]